MKKIFLKLLFLIVCTVPVLSICISSPLKRLGSTLAAFFLGFSPVVADGRLVGSMETSGFVFKDTLRVTAFSDPKVKGVTLYLSDFDRPAIEKLGNIFDDPSSASLSCVQSGPIVVKGIDQGQGGEEIFGESKNLVFKQIKVRRVFDAEAKVLVYTAFNTRFNKGSDDNKSRFKSSLCAVSLYTPPPLPAPAPDGASD